jgi:hypothetical protein
MGTIVDSNKALQLMIDYLRGTLLNTANTYLRLFKNNFTPTPASVAGDFTEADFTGYAAVQVNSKFGSPYKVIDGEYQTDSSAFSYSCSGGSSQNLYGWYLTWFDGSTTWVLKSGVFASVFAMASGGSLNVQVSPQMWALILL